MDETEVQKPERGKFFKNTFMQYMLQLAKYIFPFITIPYLTRVLGPDTYAIRAYMLAVMGFIMVVLDYGFTTYGTKVIADAEGDTSIENPFTTAIMEMRVILCVLMVPVVIALTLGIPIMSQNPVYVALAYASVVLKALLPDFVFQGREDMGIITYRFVLTQIISIVLIFLLVNSPEDLLLVPIFELGSAAIALAWSWYEAVRNQGVRFTRPDRDLLISSATQSTVFFASSAATTIISALCTVLIGVFDPDPAEISYWAVAMTAVTAVQSLYTPMVMALYPHMCSKRDFSMLQRLLVIGLPIAIVGSVAFGALDWAVMWVLGGDEYMEGAYVMRLLAPFFVFSFIGQLFGYPVLAAVGRGRDLSVSTIIAAVFNTIVLLALGFGGWFTLTTLAITRVVTEAVLAAVRVYFVIRWKKSEDR